LGSKEAATRAAAAEALAELRAGSTALAPLLRDPELTVRVAAIQAIGRSGDRSSTPALRALLGEGDVWIAANALDALGRLGGATEAEAVAPLLKSESPLLREKALDALGRLGAVGSLKAVAGGLQDKVPAVRAAALGALTRLGSPDLVPAARSLLSDDNTSVREQALMALADAGDPGSAGDVRPLIRDESSRVRIQAAEALSAVGSADDLTELLPLLDDPAAWVRARVGPMIARLGMRTAKAAGREPLIRALRVAEREPDREVSEGAAIGLLLLGGLERKGERGLVLRFRSPGITSDSRLVLDLLDALNQTHEREAFERYSRRSAAASSIDSGEALGRFAESVGVKLRPGMPLNFSGRSPEGAQTSLHDLVRRHVYPRAPVLGGGTLTLSSLHGALAEWERRLQD
jgi:HEAT repeat protein